MCALQDLSVNATQVAMLSLLVSASAWVSWYHSLVSVSVRPTPWPCISPISHTSVLRVYCQPKPQISWYVGGISAIFPGHCCLCLARCVCESPHREGDNHTLTVTHIYKPRHIAAHTLYGEEFTATNSLTVWLRLSTELSPVYSSSQH